MGFNVLQSTNRTFTRLYKKFLLYSKFMVTSKFCLTLCKNVSTLQRTIIKEIKNDGVNCRIHEYLCNYVLPHFCHQSLIIGKDLIAVFYFSVISCNVWYFVASTFCNSAANLNEWVTPALNFFCNHLLTI